MNLKTSELDIKKFVLSGFASNCYVAAFSGTGCCIVIDPGSEPEKIRDYIEKRGLKPVYIINTHGHYDHIGGNSLKNLFKDKPKIVIHRGDAEYLNDPSLNLSSEFSDGYVSPAADIIVEKDMTLEVCAGFKIDIIHTPGHTPGGICVQTGSFLFTGDLLFSGTIGRTDFPGASEKEMYASLEKIALLPDETVILPGHGPDTVLSREKKTNPFLNGKLFSSDR